MDRSVFVLGCMVAACGIGLAGEREAAACGGCFHPPTQVASDITDERMLLSVSPTQTTLYDQIRYSGNPSSFAWVLPIHGTVDVGLSADVLFDAIDAVTATQIVAPPYPCAPPPVCGDEANPGFGTGSSGAGGGANGGGVTVTKQSNVGPYETVQLHATDSSALDGWLADNGFQIPPDVEPVIAEYVTEGFDFLAMKLLPGAGVQSMRPVRVTAQGASLSLPLRMAAIGTGASVGISIWTVSDGRYEPQNFPSYRIEDKDLVWNWEISSSNYTKLRAEHEAALDGKGWEIESSLNVNKELIKNVVVSGGVYYGGGGPGYAPPAPADDDYLAVPADDSGTNTGETAEQVRADDIKALFAGITGQNVRITRMRSDISHAAMTKDFVLQASADQSELSNYRQVTKSTHVHCTKYPSCPKTGAGGGSSTGSGQNNETNLESPGCNTGSVQAFGNDKIGAAAGWLGLLVLVNVSLRRRQKRKG